MIEKPYYKKLLLSPKHTHNTDFFFFKSFKWNYTPPKFFLISVGSLDLETEDSRVKKAFNLTKYLFYRALNKIPTFSFFFSIKFHLAKDITTNICF